MRRRPRAGRRAVSSLVAVLIASTLSVAAPSVGPAGAAAPEVFASVTAAVVHSCGVTTA